MSKYSWRIQTQRVKKFYILTKLILSYHSFAESIFSPLFLGLVPTLAKIQGTALAYASVHFSSFSFNKTRTLCHHIDGEVHYTVLFALKSNLYKIQPFYKMIFYKQFMGKNKVTFSLGIFPHSLPKEIISKYHNFSILQKKNYELISKRKANATKLSCKCWNQKLSSKELWQTWWSTSESIWPQNKTWQRPQTKANAL